MITKAASSGPESWLSNSCGKATFVNTIAQRSQKNILNSLGMCFFGFLFLIICLFLQMNLLGPDWRMSEVISLVDKPSGPWWDLISATTELSDNVQKSL